MGLLHMRLEKVFDQVEHNFEVGLKKRFACAHCGKTWVEIVGLFAGNIDGQEDMYFQLGMESEVCQNCKYRIRSCPACGSKDAYEINFSNDAQDAPLSFDGIRIVRKT
jgi:transcription elongation factor Elf1